MTIPTYYDDILAAADAELAEALAGRTVPAVQFWSDIADESAAVDRIIDNIAEKHVPSCTSALFELVLHENALALEDVELDNGDGTPQSVLALAVHQRLVRDLDERARDYPPTVDENIHASSGGRS